MKDEVVLVLTIDQCASLCVAATLGMLAGVVPPEHLPDVAEAIVAISEAAGNSHDTEGFAENLAELRERFKA